MPGLYSHTTRSTGTVLTASIYNSDHQNHIDNQTPQMTDDYSASQGQMQSATDPGEVGTESLPTSLAGELERLRFAINEVKTYLGLTSAQWYSTATGTVSSAKLSTVAIAQGGTGQTSAAAALSALGGVDKTLIDAKGDLFVGTANDTVAKLPVGANGSLLIARSADANGMAYSAALNSSIYGLTYQNNGTDAANDLDIAAGGCMDATGAYWITVAALTKQSDVNWAVGNNAGGLDTGTVGNSDYYIWAIARSDTGVTDILYSLSSTAPTMPANYDFKRLIGWFKRVGATIVAFNTYETEGGGLELAWKSPTLDVDLSNTLTTSRRTDAVKVPLNFSTTVHLNIATSDAAAAIYYITCPDTTDVAPSISAAPLATNREETPGSTRMFDLFVRTSSTGTIASRSDTATVDTYRIATLGFRWSRRP